MSDLPVARLTLPARMEFLAAVLSLTRHLATQHGFDPRTVERLAFVAEEACANIMEKAYAPDEAGSVQLLLEERPGQLVFALEDQGLPFDFQDFEREDRSTLSEILARSFPGAIRCFSQGRRGNRIELILDRPAQTPLAHVAEAEIARAAEPPADADAPLTVRLMQPADAEGLARCLYRTYGYTYFAEAFYDPPQLRQLLASGLVLSFVAINAVGEVVGHLALLLESVSSPVAEAARAIVDPRYRGHHLFERLKGFARDYMKPRGLRGIYSEAVAVHPYSQKGSIALGARETGVLLADVAADVSFKKLKESRPQRQATVLLYLPVNAEAPREVWVPPELEAMVRRIYERVGLDRTVHVAAPTDRPAAGTPPSQLDVHVEAATGEANLTVRSVGPNLDQRVHYRLRELCLQRVDVIYLDVPMASASAAAFSPDLERLGFFFGGVIPEKADGDVLRWQYLNNVSVDPAQIQVASEFGKELLEFVLRCQQATR